jgi:Cu2+-exporting ATPase
MSDSHTANEEVLLASRIVGDGVRETDLSVPGIHCGGCIRTVEAALAALSGVEKARVNLSTKRVAIRWQADKPPAPFIETLNKIGYDAHLHDAGADETDKTLKELIRALAVAGFAVSNIMLLSVSIWSGADASTRNMFHWISALIAFPTLIYSDQHGCSNFDRRFACLLHEPLRDVPSRIPRLFRRRNLTFVLFADRPHA